MNRSGYFITLEGGEGSGKTEQLKRLKECLEANGHDVVTTREPGGVKVAEKIRNVLLDSAEDMDAMTEVLLYAASRREHFLRVILPALQSKKIVISDRFLDSSLIYQGLVKGVGFDQVWDINIKAIEGILPDLTLYLDCEPSVAIKRIVDNNREMNRFDRQPLAFHHSVRNGYLKLLKQFPERIQLVDANQSIEHVSLDIQVIAKERLDRGNLLRRRL